MPERLRSKVGAKQERPVGARETLKFLDVARLINCVNGRRRSHQPRMRVIALQARCDNLNNQMGLIYQVE